jgi:hypothetical protein
MIPVFSIYSQEKDENKLIFNSVSDYFNLNSESIFLHFNKSVYLSNETMWFKGYVVDKKTNMLNFETTSIYVKILDSNKNELDTKLFLATNGVIIGNIVLNENYNSGKYYIQTYTNYMNNFEEDESSIFAFEIINTRDSVFIKDELSLEDAQIEIAVEGGNFLMDCDNTIGVTIKQCNGKGIKSNNVKVYDSKNNVVNQFSTNLNGFGVFELIKAKNESYKIVLEENLQKIEKNLPIAFSEGITISVNNYTDEKKVNIKLKTNQNTLDKIKELKYKIAIQKNNEIILNDIYIEDLTKDFIIDKSSLFKGINTIRILDSENNSIAERIIYNHKNDSSKIILEKFKITKDSVFYKGRLTNKMANFSISILPEETVSNFENNSIVSQLTFNSQTNNVVENYSYYFKDFNRKKQFELDLVLLNEKKTKYNWNSIISNKPKITYSFDKGINIEGTLNNILPNKDKNLYTINLISIRDGIILNETINEKNNFSFKNLIVRDSTTLFVTLMKNNKNLNESVKLYATVTNNKNKNIKKLINNKIDCNYKSYARSNNENPDFPLNKNTILLKEVELVDTKKEKLTYVNEFGNSFSRAVKIDKDLENRYFDFLSFLQTYGYRVTRNFGEVTIQNLTSSNGFDNPQPTVYFNGVVAEDISFLISFPLSEIDEVYFNKTELGPRMNGRYGTIKIYSKKDLSSIKRNSKTTTKTITISGGFQKEISFENPYFSNFQQQAFKKYGIIDWVPNIYTDIEGNFEIKIPKLEQEKVLLNIQGIDSDGNYYFENFQLNLN